MRWWLVIGTVLLASCGGSGDICREAIEKWNDCAAAAPAEKGVPKLAWRGQCADGVDFSTSKGSWEVPLRSWSKQYLACQPSPDTCVCPDVAFLIPEFYNPE